MYKYLKIFISVILTVFSLNLSAHHIFKLSELNSKRFIGNYLGVLQDPSNTATVHNLLSSKQKFDYNWGDVPNLGVSENNNWLHLKFINDTPDQRLLIYISNPTIDEVTFYRVFNDRIDSVKATIDDPLTTRAVQHQFYAFDIAAGLNDTVTCFVKIKSTKQLIIPVSLSAKGKVVSEIIRYDLAAGVFIGIMLIVLLYNLFIYWGVRDEHYLAFVHYIFWVALVQLAILGVFTRLNSFIPFSTIHLITFGGAMSGIASIIFVKSFLNIKAYSYRLTVLLNIILAGDIAAILILFVGFPTISYQLVNFVAAVGSVCVLAVGYKALRAGNKSAKLFLVAWGIFLGSVIIYVLKDYQILPYTDFTNQAVQIGVSIEALLLSFALADKINIYRREKEESQAKALKILLEKEHLVRVQNIELERKVLERTQDLTNANETLESTLKHLKETQSQLVEAEKMASLGQLTAGVAHEINNPINFVTSNVAPLKRDIQVLWDVIEELEKIATNTGLSPEQKEQLIRNYSQEQDLDYLKTEIEFLLKGMHEGATRTAEIVKSLRIFSRVDEDSLKPADINQGLESTLVILNSLLKDKISVVKEYRDIPLVECYAGKLNQVFLNILSNAIHAIEQKFPSSAEGIIKVETIYDPAGEQVIIKITDNGTGIPEDIKDKVFEPFFTTKDVGKGVGLGMSIAYKTIQNHNGKITIDSEVGIGTTFSIVLPKSQV